MSEWIELQDSGVTWDEKEPIQGELTHVKENVGPNKSKMYMLKTKDGDVGVWGSTVLDSKFDQIPKHSEVKLEFLGKEDGKGGKQYKNYRVMYKPNEEVQKAQETFPGAEIL